MTEGVVQTGQVDWIAVPQANGRKNSHEAAGEFEALLIGQVLKSARAADGSGGWLGTGDDQSGTSMGEFAERSLAELIGRQGGLGLRRLIESGLQTQQEISAPEGAD